MAAESRLAKREREVWQIITNREKYQSTGYMIEALWYRITGMNEI